MDKASAPRLGCEMATSKRLEKETGTGVTAVSTMSFEYFMGQTPFGAILHGCEERYQRVCYASYLFGKQEYHEQMQSSISDIYITIPSWADEWFKGKDPE